MGKTRAEIQRDYRERKKKNDPNYLKTEQKRQSTYRVPASELSRSALKKRHEKNNLYCKKYRGKNKEASEKARSSSHGSGQCHEISSSSGSQPRSSRSSNESPLLVQFSFPKRNSSSKKRSKALRSANKKVKDISTKNVNLQRRLKTVQKRYERLANKTSTQSTTSSAGPSNIADMTPKSKTTAEIKQAGLDPCEVPKEIRKKLEFANVLASQIKQKYQESTNEGKKRKIRQAISGKIVKKYKCYRLLQRNIGVRRKTLAANRERQPRMGEFREMIRCRVVSFFERDDVSRCMPGKNDATKNMENEEQKTQNRILTDYLSNVHMKFLADNPDMKISFSQLCKLRPRHVKLTSMLSRSTCLCTSHQNIAYKVHSLRSIGGNVSANPERITTDQMENALSQLNESEVEYDEWQNMNVNGRKKTRIAKVKKSRDEFIKVMKRDFAAFKEHVNRVKQQYKAILDLKENLPANHALVQMDFAQNFTCQNDLEIQSAYWNSTGVTLHPVVVYYNTPGAVPVGTLQHKSFVFISELGDHNASAVLAILQKLVPLLKEYIPNLETIHYWTDSPSSQYRNRYMFATLCQHTTIFEGVNACWNYFECGHGKSVCDGIGGTVKRQAADAVKQRKVTIQDANEFYDWASTNEKQITYVMYSKENYDEASDLLAAMECQPVKGTMTFHAVVPLNKNEILVRPTSCYCDNCMKGTRCDGWVKHTIKAKAKTVTTTTEVDRDAPTAAAGENQVVHDAPTAEENQVHDAPTAEDNQVNDAPTAEENQVHDAPTAGRSQVVHDAPTVDESKVQDNMVKLVVGEFVAAVYSGSWYLGKVLEIDDDDQDAKINFLVTTNSKHGTAFKWPQHIDELWIPFNDILTKVEPPMPIGRSERFFQITTVTLGLIEGLFQAYN